MSYISTSYLTSNLAISFARNMAKSNSVYLSIGNPFASNTVAETATNSEADIEQIQSTMIGAMKVTASDIAVVTTRNSWVTGTVFDAYSPGQQTSCFVTAETAGNFYVYKVLSNNGGKPSTVKPSGTLMTPFTTADGYVWKYMWTVTSVNAERFATSQLIPVIEDANVAIAAVHSSIDSFEINDAGRGYANYLSGIFSAGDVVANTLTVYLPSTASSANGFYNNCIIENTNPSSGDYGATRVITSYNGATKAVTLDSAFSVTTTNDTYEVRPQVMVDSRDDSNNAVASAIVNTSANTIDRIIVHSRGSDHYIATANVFAHTSVGVTRQANVSPVVSPVRGHGYDVFSESGANAVRINKEFDSNTLFTTTSMTFASAALIVNPKIQNVKIIGDSGQMNRFVAEEEIVGYRMLGSTIGAVTANTTRITASGNTALVGIASGDTVAVANSTTMTLAVINAVTNSSSATVYGPTSNVAGNLYVIAATSLGHVATVNSTAIVINDYPSSANVVFTGITGKTSKSYDTVTSTTFEGGAPTNILASTILQGVVGGTFVLGETVTGNSKSGTVVAKNSNNIVVFSQEALSSNTTYTGGTSGATIAVDVMTKPTYVKNTGDVLYITNSLPINMNANKSITVNVTVSF